MTRWLPEFTRQTWNPYGFGYACAYTNGRPQPIQGHRGLIHSTEGSSWPVYSGGRENPNFTIDPWRKQRRQHVPSDIAARATMANNNMFVQIEIIGFCDLSYATKYGMQNFYLERMGADELAYIADSLAIIGRANGIPATSSVTWEAYPKSAWADNTVRLSQDALNGYSGWLGHQHTPKPDIHGDPGAWPHTMGLFDLMAGAHPSPAPRPSPTVQHVDTGQDLNEHMSKLRVEQLQADTLGFTGKDVDGIAGPKTITALEGKAGYKSVADGVLPRGGSATVRKMQATLILSEITRADIAVDGILGPKTDTQIEKYMHGGGRFVNLAKMPTSAPKQASPSPAPKQASPSPAPKPKPAGSAFPLPKGHAYAVDDGSTYTHSGVRGTDSTQVRRIQKAVGVAADGIYGPKTKAAVIAQQRKHHITADGEVGPTTWAALGL